MSKKRQLLALAIVATDHTFARREVRGAELWVGKCIFCSRALPVGLDGALDPSVTLEHITPRSHGGDDRVENLALACRSCNNEKGMRHDARPRGDPRLTEIIARLSARRRERWREPWLVGLEGVMEQLADLVNLADLAKPGDEPPARSRSRR
ncbi:MAG TPA: HNH endonuclease signature motif containing protein [Myxococcota bacterium]|nr:HNH endonuclease signature motif containing protein [Myxococcota bacterium]